MAKKKVMPKFKEPHSVSSVGTTLKDAILGGQDGLVNVLGLILGVAVATNSTRIVLISGLAATFAESISMGAVAYTSTKAQRDFYRKEVRREKWEIENQPDQERKEIEKIYKDKGFKGSVLKQIVKQITSDKKIWLNVMLAEELQLSKKDLQDPVKSGWLVFVSALIGSIIPLAPFFFLSIKTSMLVALLVSAIALFLTGAVKAKLTVGSWKRAGMEMVIIGMLAAMAGYGIGILLGAI